jgi:hypothetical protein
MSTMKTLYIGCDHCTMAGSSCCEDCVVSFICDRDPDDAVIIDATQKRALTLLGQAGLVPPLRYRACG